MKRNASAVWNGGLKDGKGTISTGSGVLANTQYSFSTRFEDGIGGGDGWHENHRGIGAGLQSLRFLQQHDG